MSRDPLNIALAVVSVLLLAVGGPYVVERLQRRAPLGASGGLPAAAAGQKRVTLHISGMMCANCASRITRELEATIGVAATEIDVDRRRATVLCDRQVADTALVHAVARAGQEFEASVAGH